MSRAVFLNVPLQGHINPTLPVVAGLARQDEQITYYAGEAFRPAVEAAGAEFRGYDAAMPLPVDFDGSPYRVINTLLDATDWALDHLLGEVRALRPDYILCDSMTLWGTLIGRMLGVPVICSITGMPASRAMFKSMRLADTLNMLGEMLGGSKDIARFNVAAGSLSRRYGLEKPGLFSVFQNRGMLNLVYTSAMFQPYAETFDRDAFRFVGPSIAPRAGADLSLLDLLDETRPLIVVSLGTLFNHHAGFYRMSLEALAGSDAQVVVAVGRRVDPAALGEPPSNVIVRQFVPQLELLRRACLFVTHGGMNSVSEALYYDVPLVVIPQGADQVWIANRVAQLGVGKVLDRRQVSAGRLRESVAEVRSHSRYAAAAARVGESLRKAGGYLRALDEIEAFKRMHRVA